MRVPEHCTADAGMFFDGHPAELALYEALFRRMDGAFPEGTVKVQKSRSAFTAGICSLRHLCRCGGGRTGRRCA